MYGVCTLRHCILISCRVTCISCTVQPCNIVQLPTMFIPHQQKRRESKLKPRHPIHDHNHTDFPVRKFLLRKTQGASSTGGFFLRRLPKRRLMPSVSFLPVELDRWRLPPDPNAPELTSARVELSPTLLTLRWRTAGPRDLPASVSRLELLVPACIS